MKLYTESQIRDALDNEDFAYISDLIIAKMQSIELPSDEEIAKKAKSLQIENYGNSYNEGINEGFYLGIEFMKQQILNNK